MLCSHCGVQIDTNQKFCPNCGVELVKTHDDGYIFTSSSDQSLSDKDLMTAFIGPKNQSFYLGHFSGFEKNKRAGISWHWPAFFVTFYWLLYRKMWLNAFLYWILPYILLIPLVIVAALLGDSETTKVVLGIGYMLYLLAYFFLPPIYANALYYRHYKKKLAETRLASRDAQRQLGILSEKGGTSNIAIIILIIFSFIAMFGILLAIAIPAYQDYTVRAKIADGINISFEAKDAVIESVNSNGGVLPIDNFAAHYIYKDKSPNVREVLIENGVVIIIMGIEPINGGSIIQTPTKGAGDNIEWSCYSPDIDNKYLPTNCRQ